MHLSTADVGDTGWLHDENVENDIVTEPLNKGAGFFNLVNLAN